MNNARSEALPGKQLVERGAVGPSRFGAVMGPNAITRVAQALTTEKGAGVCRETFAAAGIERHLDTPPSRMVDEQHVASLHRALIERLGPAKAAMISREAGRLTGEYLLAKRIPRLAQTLLRRLPRRLTAHILVRAIARNAWTFSGGGRFSFRFAHRMHLKLAGSPICRLLRTEEPACHYFVGAFERVFSEMLGPSVRVLRYQCEAAGAAACLFEVVW